MTKDTKARAIECQQWAQHYAAQAAIYLQCASHTDPDCSYRLKAMHYQHMARINATTARAILAD